jgi:hypothetical protein
MRPLADDRGRRRGDALAAAVARSYFLSLKKA